jgi:hypothetical protein
MKGRKTMTSPNVIVHFAILLALGLPTPALTQGSETSCREIFTAADADRNEILSASEIRSSEHLSRALGGRIDVTWREFESECES